MRNEWLKLHFSFIHSSPDWCFCPHEQLIFVYLKTKEKKKIFTRRESCVNRHFLQVFPLLFIALFVFIEVAGVNWFIRL